MAKFVFTESQMDKIQNRLIKESAIDTERYSVDCVFEFNYYGLTFKGNEIDDILSGVQSKVSFLIDMDIRSWGVKDISIFGFSGPETMELEISYYQSTDEDEFNTVEEVVEVPLNWENVEINEEKGSGMVTVDRDVTVNLMQTEDGGIAVKNIELTVYTL